MPQLMALDDALEALLAQLLPIDDGETCALDAALGRITLGDVHAAMDVPAFANSAMDGYAVRHDDPAVKAREPLAIIDRSLAGRPARRELAPGTCIRIFTGAALPAGADAVIAQEDATVVGDDRVRLGEEATPGKFVRAVGGDVRAGARIIADGTRLNAAHLGVLAATGNAEVQVRRLPVVTVVTTGDELRLPGEPLGAGEIHDTSRFTLPGLLAPLPVRLAEVRHSIDDPQALRDTLVAAAAHSDALICAGGVSVGDADHVRDVLAADGEVAFWRIAIKPGKPFAFGHFRTRPFFGLPGNPVSSLVTFLLLVRPALQRLAGETPRPPLALQARLAAPVRKNPGRRDFQRGRLRPAGADGVAEVQAFERQDSNVLSGVADADCLIDLPADAGDLPAGAFVRVLPLEGLLG
ncbi:MAG TPA: gephyrin-like molybdotransferase Glp [Pseudomonadales bacterium]|nr:gephyrin-like molybdotransferase Glp [Pseudomonadales bacterium]